MARRTFYEFFAGGGVARAGLGDGWRCLFANDFDPKKAASYRANWSDAELSPLDVWALAPFELPGRADLAWASFPARTYRLPAWARGWRAADRGRSTPPVPASDERNDHVHRC